MVVVVVVVVVDDVAMTACVVVGASTVEVEVDVEVARATEDVAVVSALVPEHAIAAIARTHPAPSIRSISRRSGLSPWP